MKGAVHHDVHYSRRRFLMLAAAALNAPAALGAKPAKPYDLVNIHEFHAVSDSDWTAALNQACALARRVYIPPGEYPVREANWPADTEIFGDGDSSVLRMPADARYLLTNDSGSRLPQQNIARLSMHDLQLRGSCDVDGVSEFRHLVSLNGVTDVRFQNVLFRGFRGDALYLGSSNGGGAERHNLDVVVKQCRFDGINRQNRNGVTVIDCDGMLVEGCSFQRLTRQGMPGAIDIEPNRNPYHVVRNITIRRNRFSQVGGNVGVVSVYVLPLTAPPRNIVVEENSSENYLGSGSFFHYNDNRAPTLPSPANEVRVAANDARGGASSFLLCSGKGIVLSENSFRDFTRPGRIGIPTQGMAVRDVRIERNLMLRCGSAGQSALTVHRADVLHFVGNRFIDSGNPAAVGASAVQFDGGRSSNVIFDGNVFESTSPRRLIAIRKEAAHVLTPESNRFVGNQLNGLTSFFQALKP